MASETLQKLESFRRKIEKQKMDNVAEFNQIASKCEYREDNSHRHGMYARIPACKASGIRTLQACSIDTCPAIH